jgi:hypothetical protein
MIAHIRRQQNYLGPLHSFAGCFVFNFIGDGPQARRRLDSFG